MPPVLSLHGSGGTLFLEVVSDNGWCRCHLEAGVRTFLGADDVQHIASRLLGALEDGHEVGPMAGQLEGHDVRCALLLPETHYALYVANEAQDRLLFWQNARETPMPIVGVMKLSPEQRHRWRVQIEEICPGIWPSFQGSGYLSQRPAE